MDRNGTYALVTGASSGIGREIAKQLAAQGHNVVLVARSAKRLRETADEIEREHGVTGRVLVKDLSNPETPQEIYAELDAAGLEIGVLVNNAAECVYDSFSEADLDRLAEMIQVNIAALTSLTKLFLTPMLARGSGRILNVSSGAAFASAPLVATYAASKAYVVSLSEALAHELRGTGVSVTCLCPWPTRTGIQESAGLWQARAHQGKLADPARVASVGIAASQKGRVMAIPGRGHRAQAWALRLIPRQVAVRAMAWGFERVSEARPRARKRATPRLFQGERPSRDVLAGEAS